jgi:hypothetical protein
MAKREHWKSDPEPHDFPAAGNYLSLTLRRADALAAVRRMKAAANSQHMAKDLLRASRLPLLPIDDTEVMRDLKKIRKGELLSPVLLVRGNQVGGEPLTIADGYHRVCTSYHLDEDAEIPCRLVDGPSA